MTSRGAQGPDRCADMDAAPLRAGGRCQPPAQAYAAMGATTRSFYREHMLSCRSLRQDDGRWQARVAITTLATHKTCAQRFLDLDVFNSHEAAVEHALQAGKKWVDANG